MSSNFNFIGQSGVLLQVKGKKILVDPYLSNSVSERYGNKFPRQFPPSYVTADFSNVDYIFITHAHLDHADSESLEKLILKNPNILIFCPESVWAILKDKNLISRHLNVLNKNYIKLNDDLEVNVIPAAHLELSFTKNGMPENVGYLFQTSHQIIYHSGDTIPHPEIISAIHSIGCPDIAFLPCNERNYYRDKMGIVGNMSIREMFQFAEDIKTRHVCAVHWDMFNLNSAFPEEISLLHRLLKSPVKLTIPQHGVSYSI